MTQTIISLTALHSAALAELHREGFAESWSAKDFSEVLSMPGAFGFAFAEKPNGAFVGYVLARQISDEMEILTLVVAPSARRQGLAKQLMRLAEETGRARGAQALFLEVADDNDAAIALYQGLGFDEVGRRPNYYGRKTPSGPVDARVMRLALTGCAPKAQ